MIIDADSDGAILSARRCRRSVSVELRGWNACLVDNVAILTGCNGVDSEIEKFERLRVSHRKKHWKHLLTLHHDCMASLVVAKHPTSQLPIRATQMRHVRS